MFTRERLVALRSEDVQPVVSRSTWVYWLIHLGVYLSLPVPNTGGVREMTLLFFREEGA